MDIKTPFGDAVESTPVPHRGSGSGSYDTPCVPDTPSRDGGLVPELTYDTNFGAPSKSKGPITECPFTDAVGK